MSSQSPAGSASDTDLRDDRGRVRRHPGLLGTLLVSAAFIPTLIAVIAGTASLNQPGHTRPPLLAGPAGPRIVVGAGPLDEHPRARTSGHAPPPEPAATPGRPDRTTARVATPNQTKRPTSKTGGSGGSGSVTTPNTPGTVPPVQPHVSTSPSINPSGSVSPSGSISPSAPTIDPHVSRSTPVPG